MLVSIITVTYNSASTIESTILSVLGQTYSEIEYIIIDGKSSDNTVEIINKYRDNINYFISEPDNGMYDAINKGLLKAKGDIVGIINSDDEFSHNNVISNIAAVFKKDSSIDCTISDIQFLKNNSVFRHYSAKKWKPNYFQIGIMPPHPSFYCKRICFEKIGYYRTDFTIASDFELMLRFLFVHKLKYSYIDDVIVNMKLGGMSTNTMKSNYIIYKEIKRALSINKVSVSPFYWIKKIFNRLFEYKIL